ncbi:MAG: hypothetical protein IPO31_19810 [Candidatus Obscuribacter sp.]|nr:hypothetical protein [Candidatus Obscuribacter sp.]
MAKIEPASTQSVVANPFQSIKQVAVRNEAVLDGSGKVVVNEPLTSPAPVVSARVAPENSSISAPATTTPLLWPLPPALWRVQLSKITTQVIVLQS